MDPQILAQFGPLEDAIAALGVTLWAMTDLEADDAIASAAAVAADETTVDRVIIVSPDKDLAQCVREERVVQVDPDDPGASARRLVGTMGRVDSVVAVDSQMLPLAARLAGWCGPVRGVFTLPWRSSRRYPVAAMACCRFERSR